MGTTPGMPHPSAGLMATLRTLGALTQPTCHLSMYSQYLHATTAQRGATPPLWLKTPISQCTAQAQLHLRATPLLLQHQLKGSPITLSSNSLQGRLQSSSSMLTPLHSIQESQYTLLGQVHFLGGLRVGTWMAHLSRPPEEAMHKTPQPLLHATVVRNMIQHIQGQAGLRATLGRSGHPPMPLLCMGEQVMKGMCPEEGQEGVPPLSSGPPHPESSPIVLHHMAQVMQCCVLYSEFCCNHNDTECKSVPLMTGCNQDKATGLYIAIAVTDKETT